MKNKSKEYQIDLNTGGIKPIEDKQYSNPDRFKFLNKIISKLVINEVS